VSKLDFQKQIGERIKYLRKQRDLSQRQLALDSNKDPQSLERVENGKISVTVFYLKAICDGLNVSLEEFFKGIK